MSTQHLKSISDVRGEFSRKGLSFSTWAVAHGLPAGAVYDLIHGRTKGTRGDSHKAAVLLGIKDGELPDGDLRYSQGERSCA